MLWCCGGCGDDRDAGDGDDIYSDDSDEGDAGDADGLPDVLDVVACQFEDVGGDVLEDRHDVEGHLGRHIGKLNIGRHFYQLFWCLEKCA